LCRGGGLALDGGVWPVNGALSMAMAARERGFKRVLVSIENACEASVVEEVTVYGVRTLNNAVGLLAGKLPLEPSPSGIGAVSPKLNKYDVDFAGGRGQEFAKRVPGDCGRRRA
jgi:magnesium chelatase family protein